MVLNNSITVDKICLPITKVLLQAGLDVKAMGSGSLSTSSGQDKHRWAVICYLHLFIFIVIRFRADIATIPA